MKIEHSGPKGIQSFNFIFSLQKSSASLKLGSLYEYINNFQTCKSHESGSSIEGGRIQRALIGTVSAVERARVHL